MQRKDRSWTARRFASTFILVILMLPYDSVARRGGLGCLRAAPCLLLMPPSARFAMGQAESLKGDCEKQSNGNFCWEPSLERCDYQLALRIFELIAGGTSTSIWLPKLDQQGKLEPLVRVLNQNSERLGGLQVAVSSWPKSPATRLDLSWKGKPTQNEINAKVIAESNVEASIQATEKWVEETLCGLSLCPYTYSMTRAAVGLGAVGVAEGPIHIRHSGTTLVSSIPPAAILAKAFWLGVQELAETAEDQVSTLLIVAPMFYDINFLEFADTFDKLLEPSVQAMGAEAIVGRALFHPSYNSDSIGHDHVLPGHALPAKMVSGFIDRYLAEDDSNENKKPDLASIAKANDAVRWTPHATINLLRRSQLQASKEAEATSSSKRPNWIYARNVMRILKSDILKN